MYESDVGYQGRQLDSSEAPPLDLVRARMRAKVFSRYIDLTPPHIYISRYVFALRVRASRALEHSYRRKHPHAYTHQVSLTH